MKSKDIEKVLKQTILTYVFLLCVSLIIKIMGFDYFGLDVNNEIVNKIISNNFLYYIFQCAFLFVNNYLVIRLITLKESVKFKVFLYSLFIILMYELLVLFNFEEIYALINTMLLFGMCYVINIKTNYKRILFVTGINISLQSLSLMIRTDDILINTNTIESLLLSIDYLLLLMIYYKLVIMNGGNLICFRFSCSDLWTLLKKFPTKLLNQFQTFSKNFKKLDKEKKISTVIFIILATLYNLFTLLIIFIVASLNDTVIECIFLLSSFLISKRVFGDEFHFKRMLICFVVSNLTYYSLNRITLPIEISIMTSVILGVGLAYVSSLFVKKKLVLYRGMPEDLFEETILKVTDKNSDDYKICRCFYIDKMSDIKIAFKLHYSERNIRFRKTHIKRRLSKL